MSLIENMPQLTTEQVQSNLNPMQKLLDFLAELEQRKIHYKLDSVRDAIMVEIAVPGQRWEAEFFADGRVEVEIFKSEGDIREDEALTELFEIFSD